MTSKGISPLALELHTQQKQQIKLAQRLIMSAHMQQAIHLLQLPLMELEPFIEEQIVSNPLLEIIDEKNDEESIHQEMEETEAELPDNQELIISEKDFTILKHLEEEFRDYFDESEAMPIKRASEEEKYKTYLESSICSEITLSEFLMQQARESFEQPKELGIAEVLIGYIDEFGFLKTSLNEISSLHHFSEDQLKVVLKTIQTFEPYGIGASSIQESLLIQLKCLKKEESLAYSIIQEYYEDLLHNRIPLIQKGLKQSYIKIQQAIEKDIVKLDLHPGTHFSVRAAPALIPDVTLRQDGKELVVDINREHVPNLQLNRQYFKLLDDPETSLETKNFIRRHIFSARWLMRNLNQRYTTIERIAASLAKHQHEFFTQPEGKLVPLTMKVIAEELQVHESTIARTVSNKYINSPRGLMPLRAFFTNGYVSSSGKDLSSTTVREALLELIKLEDKKHPLSDEKLCQLLNHKGIPCARRTVAKYRNELNIGNTQQRRKF